MCFFTRKYSKSKDKIIKPQHDMFNWKKLLGRVQGERNQRFIAFTQFPNKSSDGWRKISSEKNFFYFLRKSYKKMKQLNYPLRSHDEDKKIQQEKFSQDISQDNFSLCRLSWVVKLKTFRLNSLEIINKEQLSYHSHLPAMNIKTLIILIIAWELKLILKTFPTHLTSHSHIRSFGKYENSLHLTHYHSLLCVVEVNQNYLQW